MSLPVIPRRSNYPFTGKEKGRILEKEEDFSLLEKNSPLRCTFSMADLKKILKPDNCVGIRFYIASEDGSTTIAAVGLNANRERRLTVTVGEKIEQVMDVEDNPKQNADIHFFTAFFSEEDLESEPLSLSENLLILVDHLQVASLLEEGEPETYSTFTAAYPVDGTMTYLQSTAPCPPNCGGGDYTGKK